MTTRVALITGCGKRDGMGQAIARRLVDDGVTVVVTDVASGGVANAGQEQTLAASGWGGVTALADELNAAGGRALAVLGDIAVEEDAGRMVAEALAFGGRLDILVNNAAAPQGPDRGDILDVPVEVFDRVVEVNLRGTYLMCRAAVPAMREQRYGRIVNIASMAGVDKLPHSTAYSASKAGVLGLTRALAMDVGGWGITVNAVCPGLVWTSRGLLGVSDPSEEAAMRERRSAAIPVDRVGEADDIAEAVAYLASEAAGYVTGQTLPVDGGGLSPFPPPKAPPTGG
jgi:NAD(P)-dependent dehydrogenase (short-subunit alcohol dehydrogenase family)